MGRNEYYRLYDECRGFNVRFNSDKTGLLLDESFYDFIDKGAKHFLEENTELVKIFAGEDQNDAAS